MPFSDSDYSLPDGSLVSNGTSSDASQHNTPLEDIAAALTAVKTLADAADTALTGIEQGADVTDAANVTAALDDGTFSVINAALSDGLMITPHSYSSGAFDFTTDLNAAIAALSTAGGGTVWIPAGSYTLTGSIVAKSNVTVIAARGVKIDANGLSDDVIAITGTIGAEVDLDADATSGGFSVTIDTGSGLVAGDLIHLVSQRNAISADAGDWRLGDGTSGSNFCYFAEFNTIAEDLGSDEFRLSQAIIFPDYETDATSETGAQTERTAATVKKVTPIDNFHWVGGEITRTTAGSDVVEAVWAKDCTIKDVLFIRGTRAGGSIRFSASVGCYAKGCETVNDPTLEWDYSDPSSGHGTMNRYKTSGTMDCGFIECEAEFSSQAVDLTYSGAYPFANVRSYVRNCTFRHNFEECTSHPGCYQEEWRDNHIVGCYDGAISSRGLEPVIVNNICTGRFDYTDEPASSLKVGAIQLLYGGPRRASVRGNEISGFYAAVSIKGSSTQEWFWDECELSITGNDIDKCYTGLLTDYNSSDKPTGRRNVEYDNNTHSRMGRFLAELSEYSGGLSITNNKLKGALTYTGTDTDLPMVLGAANCPALFIDNNKWQRPKGSNSGKTIMAAQIGNVTDTTTYPSADWAGLTIVENNYISSSAADDVVKRDVDNTAYNQLKYGNKYQTISTVSGDLTVVPHASGHTYIEVSNTSNVDRILPDDGVEFDFGSSFELSGSSGNTVTLRDVATSAASVPGPLQLPSNTSIALGNQNDIAVLSHRGFNMRLLSHSDN